jgi:tRNA wybutosine-synthesizing protein 1
MTAVTILGLCFIFVWTVFSSSSSSSVTFQRESFEDISEPVSSFSNANKQTPPPNSQKRVEISKDHKFHQNDEKKINGSSSSNQSTRPHKKEVAREKKRVHKKEDSKENVNQQGTLEKEDVSEKDLEDKEEEGLELELDHESDDSVESVDGDSEILEDGNGEELKKTSKGKVKGPLFESNVNYRWKMCSTRSKHNYIPCIDIEVGGGKIPGYRHTERSCPRTSFMCMVPLPLEGYESPVPWPDSKLKVYEKYFKFNVLFGLAFRLLGVISL